MENIKQCFASVTNELYVPYLKVFLFSLLESNPDFSHDYVVICDEKDLTDQSKKELLELYSNVKFKQINLKNYEKLKNPHRRHHGEWAFYKLEIFSFYEYDKVTFFDIDMIVTGSIEELIKLRDDNALFGCHDYVGTIQNPKGSEYAEKHHYINTGTLIVGNNYLNKKTYNEVIKLVQENDYLHADQSLIIQHFRQKIKFLDIKFNTGYKMFTHKEKFSSNIPLSDTRIIHFPGKKKPWLPDYREMTKFHCLWNFFEHKAKSINA